MSDNNTEKEEKVVKGPTRKKVKQIMPLGLRQYESRYGRYERTDWDHLKMSTGMSND
jgi:hypothetical protein